jgi:hypothetical protein
MTAVTLAMRSHDPGALSSPDSKSVVSAWQPTTWSSARNYCFLSSLTSVLRSFVTLLRSFL